MPILLAERNNKELRGAISDITERDDPASISEQPVRIKALREKYPHSIDRVELAGRSRYNCVQYAFDLIDLPDDIRHAVDDLESWRRQRQLQRIDPFDTTFVSFLIGRGALHKLIYAESESVIVYLDDKEKVHHVGKMQGALVRSKWGHRGHLWQHRVYEVPILWGDNAPLFKNVAKDEILQGLSDFMEEVRSADTGRKRKHLLTSLHHPDQ